MTTHAESQADIRKPLTRDRILSAAVKLADEDGIGAVTMRRLAHRLGVEAMSLYHYVANKDELLDGMVELVVREIIDAVGGIDLATADGNWKQATRERILAARQVQLRHRWAPEVIETRASMSPAVIEYFDDLLALFRAGGFSYDVAHHALHALGSRALGFSQELFQPAPGVDDSEAAAAMEHMGDRYPHLVEMLAEISHDDPESTLGWCDDQTEFEFGLDLLLDGLDLMRPQN